MKATMLALAVLAAGGTAQAAVADRSTAGFEIVQSIETTAPPERAWAAVLTPSAWWSPSHSWSGSAANLSIDLEKGCFCETLPDGGFVRHLEIVYFDNARTLRMAGALGPLSMTGATGHLSIAVKPTQRGATIVLTYDVGGYAKGGLAEVWATPVDGVLGEQMIRLKGYLDGAR